MKKITQYIILSISILLLSNCNSNDEGSFERINYISFEASSLFFGVTEGSESTLEVKVYTNNVTSSDRTFNISVVQEGTSADATAYTVPASVTVPGGDNVGIIVLGLKDYTELVDDQTLTLRLESDEDLFTSADLALTLSRLCPNNGVKIAITLDFDNWPEEVAWRIKDSNGMTVLSSSNPLAYGAYQDNPDGSSTTEKYCLSSGTYTIDIFDQYGDGGTAYTITANGVKIFEIASDGYGGSTSGTLSF